MFRILFSLTFILFGFSSFAQSSWKELTSGKLVLETDGVPKDDPFEVGFLIELKKGWHTYWKNPGASGATPRFSWANENGVNPEGPRFPAPHRFDEEGIVTFGYSDKVLLIFKHPGLSESSTLKVNAEWLVCREICLPAMAEFTLEVKVSELKEIKSTPYRHLFAEAHRNWPLFGDVKVDVKGNQATYFVSAPSEPKKFDFFPFQNLPYENLIPVDKKWEEGQWIWKMNLKPGEEFSPESLGGVVDLDFGDRRKVFEFQSDATQSALGDPSHGLGSQLTVLLLAFLGGLILNLMPCVFPILSMKLFGVMKLSGQDVQKIRKDNLAYVAGVLSTFLLLGLSLSMIRNFGIHVGWGFQLQSPLFVGLLVILFVVLALEMMGYFHFDLIDPSKGQSLTRKHGLMGSFFTGVLAVVVASPCSAPFMGAAVGMALTAPGIFGALVFLFLGLGLSLPYLILAVSPQLLKWIPKPGPWMNFLKELMAFPLLFTAVWLVWIFNQIAVSIDLFVLGITVVGVVFAIWISTFGRKKAWVVAGFFLLAYVLHFPFSSLREVSASSSNSSAKEGEIWKSYSTEKLAQRSPGQVIFVNMTADWCITCKVNEKLVFENEDVQKVLKDPRVLVLQGDWTQRDEEITEFLNRYNRAVSWP